MPSNTKENGFETLIVDTLVNSNGYEQGITTEYNKQYAIDEDRLFRFLMSTQKKAMDELHILDSDLEKDRFFKQLDKKLKSDGVWTCSMFALLFIIQKPLHCTKRIFLALPGNCNIPALIPVWLWMCALLSMVCQ